MRKGTALIIFIFHIIFFAVTSYGEAQCGLSIYPTKLVIERNDKSAELFATNNGSNTCTFKSQVIDIETFEDGQIKLDQQNVAFSAKNMLRVSPKVFTLAPNAQQRIRIKVRRSSDISNGEYRSHILMSVVGKVQTNKGKEGNEESALTLGSVPININISFPVLIRVGKTDSNISIDKIALEKDIKEGAPVLDVTLKRAGNKSVYGFLNIDYRNKKGEIIPIERTGIFAIYRSIDMRIQKIKLEKLKNLTKDGGQLIVRFIKSNSQNNRDSILKFETSDHYKLLDKKEIDI